MKKWFIKNLLDTPEGHWLVVFSYHVHKSFWGVILLVVGIVLSAVFSAWYLLLFVPGIILITVDIAGHIYTNHKPLFVMLEKHSKSDRRS